jgi:aspartyl-tRNA(Asn)/glutamyl-tRNA(Gln) amidotransferase subunit B
MQHYMPIATGGRVEIEGPDGIVTVDIERVHIEEDAGKIVYDEETGECLIDLNRCGTPLLEVVTEPWISTPEEVHAYLNTVKQIFQYIGISDCDMEKGNLRCDANISVMPRGSKQWGTRTEIKNLNSFRAVQRALEYEKKRQIEIIESGGRVVLETLLWDEKADKTSPQRSKEEAHDYRYFPEPDLPPLVLDRDWIDPIGASMPELPAARRRRFTDRYGLPAYDAQVLTSEKELADFFEETVKHYDSPKSVANWVMTELMRELKARCSTAASFPVRPVHVAELVQLLDSGTVTSLSAKEIFSKILATGIPPSKIAQQEQLTQQSDEDEVRLWVTRAISSNPRAVIDYKKGKKTAAQFLVGQVMKESRGRANPRIVLSLLKKMLSPD